MPRWSANLLTMPLRPFGCHADERRLRSHLRGALESEQHRLPPEQAMFVRDFIEHGEYLLALEQLQDALDNLDVQPCPEAARAMEEAATIMQVGQ